MRWKSFSEVPENIRNKYFITDARSGDFGLIFIRKAPLMHAVATYWDRNTPLILEKGAKWNLDTPPRMRRRYYDAMGIKDKSGMWYPHPYEVEDCCKELKATGHIPWEWRRHCNSIKHIATKHKVDYKELKAIIMNDLGVDDNPRHCTSCGSFALQNSLYCTRHQIIEEEWQKALEIC